MPGSGLEKRPLYNNKTGHFRYDILIGLFLALLIMKVKNTGAVKFTQKKAVKNHGLFLQTLLTAT
jgi:hypothetical protein